MKTAWKYILAGILFLALAIGGTVYYFLEVKTYDVADEEVEEITESDYDIQLPVVEEPTETNQNNNASETNDEGTTTESDTDHNSLEDKDTSTTNTGKNSTKDNTTTTKTPSSSKDSTKTEVTVAYIKGKYRPVFESLESQANGKIDALVSRAIGEYQQKKNNGEEISYAYFYQKYTSAGKQLENRTDEMFGYIYEALEGELKKHGYSPSHANEFKSAYESAKESRSSALIEKAKSAAL
jgi:hypothetical protein